MTPSKNTKHIKQHPTVATAAATIETPVPTTPTRKRIPVVKASLVEAALNANPSVSQTPTSTVVSVTSTTPANGSTTSPASSTSTPTPLSFAGMVSPPPSVVLPSPPTGYVPPAAREFSGFYPTARELETAPAAATDLQNFTNYLVWLGMAAPAAANVVQAIEVAILWRNMRAATETWDAYVRGQDGAAWKVALTFIEELKPLFANAVAKDPSLALTYKGLATMLGALKAGAGKRVASRSKKAKANAAGPAIAAASAPTTEASAAASPAAVPTKSITVTV